MNIDICNVFRGEWESAREAKERSEKGKSVSHTSKNQAASLARDRGSEDGSSTREAKDHYRFSAGRSWTVC